MRTRIPIAFLFMALSPAVNSGVAMADSTWTVYNSANSPLPTDLVSSIYFDNARHEYVGTSGGGLVVKTDSLWTIWNQSNTGVPIDVARLEERDSLGNLWVGSASGNLDVAPYGFGVARLDVVDSTWSMHNGGLEVSQIVTGIVLWDGYRYVSTYGGGITIYGSLGWIRYRYASRTEFSYADSQQQTFDVPPGTYIPSNYIRAIDINRADGDLWIATADGGAVKYSAGTWTTFNSGNSGLPSNQLLDIRVNPRNGNVVFGTAGAGFAILSDSVWTVYSPSNSPMPDGRVSAVEVRPINGEIWVGTGQGVWVLQMDGGWRSYIAPDSNFISGEFYSDISFDSTDAVWVAAYGSGIASLTLSHPPPPPDTLRVATQRLYIFFFRHRPVERLFGLIDITNAPNMSANDTVALFLTSTLGELYSFQVRFGDFRRIPGHFGDRTTYSFHQDDRLVLLGVNESDPSDIEADIADFDARMNRDNFANTLTLTFRLGSRQGHQVINLRHQRRLDTPGLTVADGADSADVYEIDLKTVAGDGGNSLPRDIMLTNYPNPFNGQTLISFDLPSSGQVEVDVYDILGRRIDQLYSGNLTAGQHAFVWPVSSSSSQSIGSGVFFYRLQTSGKAFTGRMVYLK